MADKLDLALLKQGRQKWNRWRERNQEVVPNLYSADLQGMCLSGFDLSEATLSEANLQRTDLSGASLFRANLYSANLSRSNLTDAGLQRANFTKARLTGAKLNRADLEFACLVQTRLERADLSNCRIYGTAVWDVRLDRACQENLVITRKRDPIIQVDNLEVAQFIYLLLNNKNIRHVIDTITSKVVLILGRFTPDRKVILDAIREELRRRDHLPVLFDFEKPANRDITETVSTLAHMARFVIADITDAKSIPQELMAIVPALPSVPVQPLLLASQREYGMFEHFKRFPWVLEPFLYEDQDQLLASLDSHVVGPAEKKTRAQTKR